MNPGAEWVPVVTEFEVSPANLGAPGHPGPPFTRVQSEDPSIPSAWEALKELVRVRVAGLSWGEDPAISSWRPWYGTGDEEGLSGIEVKRSDRQGNVPVPLIHVEVGQRVRVLWKIEIWGRYRLPERPELFPADEEYQRLIKRKIEVRDISVEIHKIKEREGTVDIRDDALPDAYYVLSKWDGVQSLAYYEGQGYEFPPRGAYVGEMQLKLSLWFPEFAEQAETASDVRVEAAFRFLCGSLTEFRVISREVRDFPGGRRQER